MLSAFGDGLSAVSNLHGAKWIAKVSFLQLAFTRVPSTGILMAARQCKDVRARLDVCLG